jgi:hypothetical protein
VLASRAGFGLTEEIVGYSQVDFSDGNGGVRRFRMRSLLPLVDRTIACSARRSSSAVVSFSSPPKTRGHSLKV